MSQGTGVVHMTREEDADLRCLTALSEIGELSHAQQVRLAELRAKDARTSAREPQLVVALLPHQR